MKYGEKIIAEFDPKSDLELWDNPNPKNRYEINISLPEFTALCPRSGYPDFAEIKIDYVPHLKVVELKALKLYINSFRNRYISHESAANEIYNTLLEALKPHSLKVTADFLPRGNVHTTIVIDSLLQEQDKR
ncbi:MAG: preQ(1) synthase [Helicobacteraceae bacterium]|jgi:7-cyano-7-deazaguanine reductase|nr:preQ(1) synthase [Helicobacteraceae bacterium]